MANGVILYKQLSNELLKMIEDHIYVPGQKMPSERALSEKYKVSRVTVRQALDDLEKLGYLYRVHGSGTYVSKPSLRANMSASSLYSFSKEVERMGYENKSSVTDFHIENCPADISNKLGLNEGDPVFSIQRIRLCNETAISFESSYVPVKACPNLSKAGIENDGLYNSMNKCAGIIITATKDMLSATVPTKNVCKYLNVSKNMPMMKIQRIGKYYEVPVEYSEGYIRGDSYFFVFEMK